ncbi:sulfur carrier protein ThiS [Parahaliea mediterranea]|uniref:Sulfur carrier protein ThiS n=1 Tax=Parahaliea mediterranea TaxID=651086 RepID=A0A939DJQ3_9GAMM|nr:sulfur carrier protein ThiS [Parahaliea mediterranea]MBN7798702.1 sulfur carrier protein ThiS [Parahaliea mediterranea]
MSIHITLNGSRTSVADATTLRQLVRWHSPEEPAVAVALNQRFIPRSEHGDVHLSEGDEVELVTPMQGG